MSRPRPILLAIVLDALTIAATPAAGPVGGPLAGARLGCLADTRLVPDRQRAGIGDQHVQLRVRSRREDPVSRVRGRAHRPQPRRPTRAGSSGTGAEPPGRVARARALTLTLVAVAVAVAVAGCGTDHPSVHTAPRARPSSPGSTSKASGGLAAATPLVAGPGLIASVERALARNPNQEASFARCRPATGEERRRAPFGTATRRPILRCTITWGGRGAEAYDLEILGNGCFVGERVRPGRGDSGCGAVRVALPS